MWWVYPDLANNWNTIRFVRSSVVATSQCVQPLVRMVSFIIMPLLVLTILPTLSPSFLLCIICSFLVTPGINQLEQSRLVIIWDNVRFHQAALVRNCFLTIHKLFSISEPCQRVIFSMVLKVIGLPAPPMRTPSPCDGGGLCCGQTQIGDMMHIIFNYSNTVSLFVYSILKYICLLLFIPKSNTIKIQCFENEMMSTLLFVYRENIYWILNMYNYMMYIQYLCTYLYMWVLWLTAVCTPLHTGQAKYIR